MCGLTWKSATTPGEAAVMKLPSSGLSVSVALLSRVTSCWTASKSLYLMGPVQHLMYSELRGITAPILICGEINLKFLNSQNLFYDQTCCLANPG